MLRTDDTITLTVAIFGADGGRAADLVAAMPGARDLRGGMTLQLDAQRSRRDVALELPARVDGLAIRVTLLAHATASGAELHAPACDHADAAIVVYAGDATDDALAHRLLADALAARRDPAPVVLEVAAEPTAPALQAAVKACLRQLLPLLRTGGLVEFEALAAKRTIAAVVRRRRGRTEQLLAHLDEAAYAKETDLGAYWLLIEAAIERARRAVEAGQVSDHEAYYRLLPAKVRALLAVAAIEQRVSDTGFASVFHEVAREQLVGAIDLYRDLGLPVRTIVAGGALAVGDAHQLWQPSGDATQAPASVALDELDRRYYAALDEDVFGALGRAIQANPDDFVLPPFSG